MVLIELVGGCFLIELVVVVACTVQFPCAADSKKPGSFALEYADPGLLCQHVLSHCPKLAETWIRSLESSTCPLVAVALAAKKHRSSGSCCTCCTEPHAATMENPEQMEIPELASLQVGKNKENWFETPARDDTPGYTRHVIKLAQCPFTPCYHRQTGAQCEHCSKPSFSGANMWSLCIHHHVLGYLLQHGTHSDWHKLSLNDAYDQLVQNWHLLEWEVDDDTYEDRQHYRGEVEADPGLSAESRTCNLLKLGICGGAEQQACT